jgi:heme exporter protein D
VRGDFDFSSWQTILSTVIGLTVVTLVAVGIRLLVMQTVQRRRERENRQINERLRTLIAAYKTLGGSFTGDLAVDPTHLRELSARGALSDVILLGTAEQVALAVDAANALVAGRQVETAELVRSLRAYIREVLDLEPLPALEIPRQGPSRTTGGGAGRARGGNARRGGGEGQGGAGEEG